MNMTELEAEALKLNPRSRARPAEKLLASLENLSEEENVRLWDEEARRRAAEMDVHPASAASAKDVFLDARAKLS